MDTHSSCVRVTQKPAVATAVKTRVGSRIRRKVAVPPSLPVESEIPCPKRHDASKDLPICDQTSSYPGPRRRQSSRVLLAI